MNELWFNVSVPHENADGGGKEKADMNSQTVYVSNWCKPRQSDASINVSPVGYGGAEFPRLAERATIVIESGVARLQFSPTAAEARALIEALEWALQPVEHAEAA